MTEVTLDQEIQFIKRTMAHIHQVQENMVSVAMAGGMFGYSPMDIVRRAISHDISKFNPDLYKGYVLYEHRNARMAAERGRMREEEYLRSLDSFIFEAVKQHRSHSSHHPECFPDVNDMSGLDIIEMVCDWKAVEQKIGDIKNTARLHAEYALENVYRFEDGKKRMIFEVLDFLDGRTT